MKNGTENNRKSAGDPGSRHTFNDLATVRKYFKQLRARLIVGFLVGFMLPYCALAAYFHFQFNSTLEKTGMLNLSLLAESQRNTVDLFLQERVVNLFNLFNSTEFSRTPTQQTMENYLSNLGQMSDSFVDVGFLNENGIQVGYAGPFPHLQGRDYSREEWLKTLINQEQDYFISDIYKGLREKLHFTIATKQMIDGHFFIMRSTLDPEKFHLFLKSIIHGREVAFSLQNNKGVYQAIAGDHGELLGLSDYMPRHLSGTGGEFINENGEPILIAHAWLGETPWVLVVRQPLSIVYAEMYKTRWLMNVGLVLFLIAGCVFIWFAIVRLTGQTQAVAEQSNELFSQLQHTSKLASVGKLVAEVAHEVNNPLAIITSTSGVIRDMLDPEIDMDSSPEEIIKELDTIEAAAFRARENIRFLLELGHKHAPRFVLANVNDILEEVVGGFLERELKVKNIEICRNYDISIPEISLNHDQIMQVLLNLINNAVDAISGAGTITMTTNHDDKNVRIIITDTGEGMTPEQTKKIFNPFYTTKEVGKGTGLGLSVSLEIVESMDGTLDVQSEKGSGSSFTISLPIINMKFLGDFPPFLLDAYSL